MGKYSHAWYITYLGRLELLEAAWEWSYCAKRHSKCYGYEEDGRVWYARNCCFESWWKATRWRSRQLESLPAFVDTVDNKLAGFFDSGVQLKVRHSQSIGIRRKIRVVEKTIHMGNGSVEID